MNAVTPAHQDSATRAFSVDDLRRMIEAGIIDGDERLELIDGELVEMAAKGFAHELVKSGLVRRFIEHSTASTFVGIEASLRLDTHVLVEPDILVCRRADVVPAPEGYIGVPAGEVLLLVEVSDTTLRKDRVRKAALYARYGIPEYWIVDVNERVVWCHLDPAPGGYGSIVRHGADAQLRPQATDLAGMSVKLADLA